MSGQIIVHIDGGIVQGVSAIETNDPNQLQSVIVVDTDIDQAFDEEDLTTVTDKDGGKIQADVHEVGIEALPEKIRLLVEQYLKDVT